MTRRTLLTLFIVSFSLTNSYSQLQLPPAKYAARFDASHVSSGVYFYRLEAGNFSRTKSLILLK